MVSVITELHWLHLKACSTFALAILFLLKSGYLQCRTMLLKRNGLM